MRKIGLLAACLLTLMTFPTQMMGQQDFGSVLGLTVNKKLSKRVSIDLQEEWRTRDDFSKIERFSSTLGLNYKLNNTFDLGAGYNLINFHNELTSVVHKDWEVRHRWFIDITGKKDVNKWEFSLRERFQQTYRMGVGEQYDKNRPSLKMMLLSQIQAVYKLNDKWTPYFSAEVFDPLNNPSNNDVEKLRFTLGANYKLNKHSSLNVFYRFDDFLDAHEFGYKDIDNGDNNGRHYLGAIYSFSF